MSDTCALDREDRVLLLELARGIPLETIARRGELSRSTIQRRVARLREDLGARTTIHLVVIAIRRGLI